MYKLLNLIKNHQLISIVLMAGLLASLSYAFYFQVHVSVDAKAYDSIAWSLVQGTGYTETTSLLPHSSIGRLGPAYEFFLAFWYLLFGHQVWIIWVVQSFLHAGSGFLIYLIIRKLASPDTPEGFAVAGAAFYLFFIDLLEFPAMLFAETLYLFIVLLGFKFSIDFWRKPTARLTIIVSAILALAVLVRTPALFLLLLTFGFLAFNRYFRFLILGVIVAILIMTPWTVRNWITFHRFIPTADILGYDLWIGNSPQSKHPGELTATKEIDDFVASRGIAEANKRGIREFFDLMFGHPDEFIKLQLTKASIYFSAARPAAFWFHLHGLSRALTAIFSSIFAYVIFTFGFAGLWYMAKRRDYLSRMTVLFTLAAPASVIWIVVETRYRYQIYPMLIILGMLFLRDFLKDKRLHWKILAVSIALITANTTFDLLRNSERILEHIKKII